MIKRFLLLLIFCTATFFCVADGEIPSTGNDSVDSLFLSLYNQLDSAHTGASSTYRQIDIYYNNASAVLDEWQHTLANSGTTSPYQMGYNQGRVDGGGLILNSYFEQAHDLARDGFLDVVGDIQSAQEDVIQLARLFSDNTNALNDILQAISNNTRVISFSINTNMAVCISNVQEIVSILHSVFPSASGSDDDIASAVDDLDTDVKRLVIDFAVFWETVDSVFDWFDDLESDFRKFYQIARSRLTAPDYKLSAALRDMWDDTCEHRAEIVYGALTNLTSYTVQDQTEIVLQQVSQDLRLSNEGQIALENLAVNTRTYLALVELCNKQQTNSIADLAWFTNYLSKIQAPFFTQYNQLFSSQFGNFSPFLPKRYSAFTNFVDVLMNNDSIGPKLTAYSKYSKEQTNVLARLETLLLYQNGLIGPTLDIYGGDETEYEFSNHLDRENVERNFNYATNSVSEFVQNVSSVTNNLYTLFTSIKSCLDAFDLSQGGEGDGVFRLSPTYELGGVQMGGFYLNWSDFSDITDTCRIIFQVIWYFLFGFISYKFTVLTFLAFTKSLKFFVGIFSRLMS